MSEYIRLAWAIAAFVFALFVLLPAPSFRAFVLSVAATEYGHFFALIPVLVFLLPGWGGLIGKLGSVLCAAAFGLLCSPAVRAALCAPKLKRRFEASFGCQIRAPLLSLRRLWKVETRPRIRSERFYFDGPGSGLFLEFYRCREAGARPALVVIHGGGWMAGHPSDMAPMCAYFADRGFHVVSLSYRFAPRAAWPSQLDDIRAGLDFLVANASRFGVDPQRLVLFGRSAGGQLASVAALRFRDLGIRGCVALYAPLDMLFAYKYSHENDLLRSRWVLRSYLGGDPASLRAVYRASSPFHLAGKHGLPFLVVHGGRDELVLAVQSKRFARRLKKLREPHCLFELPWATHACDFNLHGPAGQVISNATLAFAATVCSPRDPSIESHAFCVSS